MNLIYHNDNIFRKLLKKESVQWSKYLALQSKYYDRSFDAVFQHCYFIIKKKQR